MLLQTTNGLNKQPRCNRTQVLTILCNELIVVLFAKFPLMVPFDETNPYTCPHHPES